MSKSVPFGTRPGANAPLPPEADEWVEKRTASAGPAVLEVDAPAPAEEPVKRLTVDLPASLHGRVKAACALRGAKMSDVIRELLEQHFPE